MNDEEFLGLLQMCMFCLIFILKAKGIPKSYLKDNIEGCPLFFTVRLRNYECVAGWDLVLSPSFL
ncbi:hypothetical protein D3C76_713030 [compost metagenome]